VLETRSSEVAVDLLGLGRLPLVRSAKGGKLDEADAQGASYRKNAAQAGDPDAVKLLKVGDVLRHGLGDDDGKLGVGGALIFLKFGKPTIRPGSGAFRLPKNLPTSLTRIISDVLKDIATELAFTYRLDEIERKLSSQLVLEGELKGFALRLLGTLLGPSLEAPNLFV
jgi:hypothetical protein